MQFSKPEEVVDLVQKDTRFSFSADSSTVIKAHNIIQCTSNIVNLSRNALCSCLNTVERGRESCDPQPTGYPVIKCDRSLTHPPCRGSTALRTTTLKSTPPLDHASSVPWPSSSSGIFMISFTNPSSTLNKLNYPLLPTVTNRYSLLSTICISTIA